MATIEELLSSWEGDFVVTAHDAPTGAWIFLAIHDRTLGMALGGCRLSIYTSPAEGLRDALRLARGMTAKWAALDFPFGGGKTVIALSRPLDPSARERLLLRLGDIIHSLRGLYGTGVDLGTSSADMAVVGRRTRWVFGRPPELGGRGDPGPWTARGVHAGLRAACGRIFGEASVAGRTVLVQGVGGVGGPLARRLAADGARLLLSDAIPERAEALARELDAEVVQPEDVYDAACDIFAPCAIGGILNGRSIARLRCRIVGGSANNQLERDADAALMHARGIVYVPDFVINAGGAIAHASLEVMDWTDDEAAERIEKIEVMVDEILAEADARNEPPLLEAVRRAERILEKARAGAGPRAEPA